MTADERKSSRRCRRLESLLSCRALRPMVADGFARIWKLRTTLRLMRSIGAQEMPGALRGRPPLRWARDTHILELPGAIDDEARLCRQEEATGPARVDRARRATIRAAAAQERGQSGRGVRAVT